jgi:hypothetical protein
MHRVVGSTGVFATRSSGMVTAIANADAPMRKQPGFSDTPSHNDAVRAYFVRAGIPNDQILSVQDFEVVGAPMDGGKPVAGKVVARYSMVKRQVDGVPVPDSFAWAMLNKDMTVVEEQVYWPALSAAVAAKAKALTKRMEDPGERGSFKGKLPEHGEERGVAIRHSPGVWDHEFEEQAVFDVISNVRSMPSELHFDENAAAVAFGFERRSNAPDPMPTQQRTR